MLCVTNPPFRSRPLSPTNPRTTTSTGVGPSTHPGGSSGSFHHATHTPSGEEICRRFNFGKCTKGAECTFAHMCSVMGCSGITLPRPAPGSLQELRELQRAHTPLRRSAFEHELKAHPDKAWVSWLLNGIDNSVSTGYNGPHFSYTARNLTSALQHPDVVDDELQKEVESGRILGPFCQPPPSRTSAHPGLGQSQRKTENGE